VDHPQAVEAYEMWHRPGKTPAEVIEFFRRHGVEDLRIHRAGNRLFMTLDLSDDVSAADFAKAGSGDDAMTAWANQMAAYQFPISFGAVAPPLPSPGWVSMSELFKLKDHF
jgi:L-rhamnose mutarotase